MKRPVLTIVDLLLASGAKPRARYGVHIPRMGFPPMPISSIWLILVKICDQRVKGKNKSQLGGMEFSLHMIP